MTDHTETEIRLAEEMKRWTTELDDVSGAQCHAIIAAAAMQLAIRYGFAMVARDLRELAEVHEKAARRGVN